MIEEHVKHSGGIESALRMMCVIAKGGANALVVESGVLLMKFRRVDGATERVTTAFGH